ncbi:MAG TPA: acetyl-CoA carboxylase biotin carboxyl carrier protein [Clostridiaceae bacterium]|nr:acetyl-CoA carboxylase biotin carboxyl carrier protein [Clostridiaceae bacterium]
MDIKTVKTLMQEMARYGLTELEWKGEGVKLKLKRGASSGEIPDFLSPAETATEVTPAHPAAVNDNATNDPTTELNDSQELNDVDLTNKTIVKSPVVGVFYASASPEAKPYVEEGQKIKKGDVLCIIEAMKLMNEVLSEVDGEVINILVSDGEKVEYGQPLIEII